MTIAGDVVGETGVSATPGKGGATNEAQARIALLRADSAWMGEYMRGDPAKVDEFTRLHQAAFSDEAAQPVRPAAAPEVAQAADEDSAQDLGLQKAGDAAFAPPREPMLEYREPLPGGDGSDGDIEGEIALKQEMAEAGLPPFAYSVLQTVATRTARDGIFGDEEAQDSHYDTRDAELERRFGAEAERVRGDALKAFDRLGLMARAYILASGAHTDPHFIDTLARLERDYYAKRA